MSGITFLGDAAASETPASPVCRSAAPRTWRSSKVCHGWDAASVQAEAPKEGVLEASAAGEIPGDGPADRGRCIPRRSLGEDLVDVEMVSGQDRKTSSHHASMAHRVVRCPPRA